MGMLIQKIQRQEKKVEMKPPSGGPMTGPMSAGTVSQARAEMSSRLGHRTQNHEAADRHHHGAAHALDDAEQHEVGQAVGEAAGRRAQGKDDDGCAEYDAGAEAVGHPAA